MFRQDFGSNFTLRFYEKKGRDDQLRIEIDCLLLMLINIGFFLSCFLTKLPFKS